MPEKPLGQALLQAHIASGPDVTTWYLVSSTPPLCTRESSRVHEGEEHVAFLGQPFHSRHWASTKFSLTLHVQEGTKGQERIHGHGSSYYCTQQPGRTQVGQGLVAKVFIWLRPGHIGNKAVWGERVIFRLLHYHNAGCHWILRR